MSEQEVIKVVQNIASEIHIDRLKKDYAEHTALDSVDLKVASGEFLTLLGPSGSGKSTLLHLIAGLGEATSGDIYIDGEKVTDLPAQKRGIGLVFQSYALFPHMSAKQNIEFPLTVQKGNTAEERAERVEEILALVDLAAQADRHPSEMSGGQQQRVAVGRALSGSPKVLLLDEPLGALDRKLRHQLGRELRRIQQETSVTTVYVTHDQEEAFLMSDRIAVMNNGRIQQIGTPEEIYFKPANIFVASFIGEINYLPTVYGANGQLQLVLNENSHEFGAVLNDELAVTSPREPVLGVRLEHVHFVNTLEELYGLGQIHLGTGILVDRVFQGNSTQLTFALEDGRKIRAVNHDASSCALGTTWHLGVNVSKTVILDRVDGGDRFSKPSTRQF